MIVQAALSDLVAVYAVPMPPLAPRPALFLFCHVVSSLCLLEHAIWAFNAQEETRGTNADVFIKWVEEHGLEEVARDVQRARHSPESRLEDNYRITYGISQAGQESSELGSPLHRSPFCRGRL